KEVLNRNELKSFHQDLDNHLKERIPHIYQKGILNDKTIGVENVQILKEKSKEIDQLGKSMDQKKRNLNNQIKKVNRLEGKFKKRIQHIYHKEILNDKNIVVENVQIIKEKSKEIDELGKNMDQKKRNLNNQIKKVNSLEGKFKNVYDTRKKLDEFENKLGKT